MSRPLRVLYVWDADYPWDVRTEKVCASLTAAGHAVMIAARNRGWDPPRESRPEGMVRRMAPWRPAGARLDQALSFPAFCNPRWATLLRGLMREHRPELVMVRDLPLGPTAIWAAGAAGVPVVMDMAENYPAMLRQTRDAGRHGRWDFLLRNPDAATAVERWCLPRLEGVLVVVEESAERLASLGFPRERISIVSNTPPAARAAPRPSPAGERSRPLELVYLGLMEAPRGVGELLEAASRLQLEGQRIHVSLIGDGRDLEMFRARAGALGLGAGQISFLGRLPHAEALQRVAAADVGVVPHHADEAWNTTIPNKLFDYMAAGIPVLSSDAKPAARILRETCAGLVYRSGDSAALAAAAAALTDPVLRRRLGAAGQQAVRDRYNWEADAASLVDAVERAAGLPGPGGAGHRPVVQVAAAK